MMFSDILFYTLCFRSIEKASKEEIPFCFDMMKKEMAKHQERYTLLDELALGEEKEDEEEKKERSEHLTMNQKIEIKYFLFLV